MLVEEVKNRQSPVALLLTACLCCAGCSSTISATGSGSRTPGGRGLPLTVVTLHRFAGRVPLADAGMPCARNHPACAGGMVEGMGGGSVTVAA
jgi:hypothetical protein